jgi:hypothetical protein
MPGLDALLPVKLAIYLLQSGQSNQLVWVSFLATMSSNMAPPVGQQ